MDLLRELAEPSKRQILAILRSGPKSVGDLVEATGLKQPNVSNHLSRLSQRGLVQKSKVGRQVFYSLASAEVTESLSAFLSNQPDEPQEEVILSEEMMIAFAKAAVAGDEIECTRFVDVLLRQRHRLIDIYQNLFGKSLITIGKWWEVQAVDVGQEHLASAIIERLMARVVHHAPPPQTNSMTALLGCAEGNWHTLGLRMISDLLRLAGWRTYYLGANVPNDSFMSALTEHRPYVVMISCPIPDCEDSTLKLLERLREYKQLNPSLKIGMGGGHVISNEAMFRSAGANFIGRSLSEFAEITLPELERDFERHNSTGRRGNVN